MKSEINEFSEFKECLLSTSTLCHYPWFRILQHPERKRKDQISFKTPAPLPRCVLGHLLATSLLKQTDNGCFFSQVFFKSRRWESVVGFCPQLLNHSPPLLFLNFCLFSGVLLCFLARSCLFWAFVWFS